MKLKAVASFCRRMGVGLKAGVDILRILESETKSGDPKHRQVMTDIVEQVRSGTSLARSMLEHKSYFPPLLIQMVSASELGGRMDSTFLDMANYYDDLVQTRRAFASRIAWPVIQLVMAVGIIGLVILIQGLLARGPEVAYDAAGMGLSGVRGFVIYMTVVSIITVLLGTLAYGIIKNWFNCHRVLMPIVQRIPSLGTALETLGLSRLCMTLSMLLNAGVEARRSLKQAFYATGNYYFISGVDRALATIEQGSSFGDSLAAADVFPQDFIEAIRIGELSGTETESLDYLAVQYRERSKAALGFLAVLASTAIWLFIMALIAFVILRMALQYVALLNSLM